MWTGAFDRRERLAGAGRTVIGNPANLRVERYVIDNPADVRVERYVIGDPADVCAGLSPGRGRASRLRAVV